MIPQLQAALWHAKHGVYVFPLQLADKRPLKGSHGELDGTLDPDVIKRWWSRVPYNIGAALRFTDYFALDIDSRSGGDELLDVIEEENGKLPDTVTVISASGWPNRHHWFRKPPELKDCRVSGLGIGIDVKDLGHGYVLVPPSETPKGVYRYEDSSYLGQLPVAEPPTWLVSMLLNMARIGKSHGQHKTPVTEPWRFTLWQLFAADGAIGKQIKPGIFSVICPWRSKHSCGKDLDGSTVVYAPNHLRGNAYGAIFCMHSHCAGLTEHFKVK